MNSKPLGQIYAYSLPFELYPANEYLLLYQQSSSVFTDRLLPTY